MYQKTLEIWHEMLEKRDPSRVPEILSEDAVMISPVVHTPQRGKKITSMYLMGAFHVLTNDSFQYISENFNDKSAVLEFTTTVDGIEINGVDMLTFNDEGLITEFKVMVRPLQAMNLLHKKMGEMLEILKTQVK